MTGMNRKNSPKIRSSGLYDEDRYRGKVIQPDDGCEYMSFLLNG